MSHKRFLAGMHNKNGIKRQSYSKCNEIKKNHKLKLSKGEKSRLQIRRCHCSKAIPTDSLIKLHNKAFHNMQKSENNEAKHSNTKKNSGNVLVDKEKRCILSRTSLLKRDLKNKISSSSKIERIASKISASAFSDLFGSPLTKISKK